jgi:prepilin-type N-terminal cleavage/methylation domain-containing protein
MSVECRAIFAALRRARVSSVEMSAVNAARPRHVSRVTRHASHSRAFTLIELLMVIAILGIMAGLTVPVLKNFARSDATLGASRQLLDGVARARQLAISQRTTVYMVFVPPNFWNDASGNFNSTWFNPLTFAQQTAATNLCDKQFTGYTFVSLRSVGDQPGQGAPHYLAPWQTLPDNTFIALAKFTNSPAQSYPINDPVSGAVLFNIYGFNYTNIFPFPTETTSITANTPALPYIAFNYLGQLASVRDEYIPIAKGSVLYARDPATKAFQFNPPDASEMPPGNSTNSSYNIVHIDRLTGRAVLEYQKMAP